MGPIDLFYTFAVSFLLTLALKYPAAILFGIRNRKDLLLLLPVNLLTNPAAVALALFLRLNLGLPALPAQICLEIPVILAEGLLYRHYGQDLPHPLAFSLCANGFSYTMGLLIQTLF